ncbi:MAG: hypothetical protein JWM41_2778 [Gemmatimonadetes bacterium]|nr:hypothetical protein [Gemmatimonadota bacterium]
MRRWAAMGSAGALAAVIGATQACGGGDNMPPPLRQMSNTYSYTITPDDAPPHARQDIHFKIQILDRKTRQPIESGEGQLFASNNQGAKTWDALAYGPEIGTYHAKLNYVVAGTWAVAIRFRRDSLRPLERIDWMQEVHDEKPSPTP